MGKLSKEEEDQLKALTDKANAKDDDDDDEIEWWEEDDKGKRRGGRMTVKRARSTGLFSDIFGEKKPEDGKKDDKGKAEDDKDKRTSTRYFGNNDK